MSARTMLLPFLCPQEAKDSSTWGPRTQPELNWTMVVPQTCSPDPFLACWTALARHLVWFRCISLAPSTNGTHSEVLSAVQLRPPVVCNSLQHARPPCPSPTPGAYTNSCPLSRWCHLAISSSVVPFSSCRQSLPASGRDWLIFQWVNSSHEVAKVLECEL